MTKPEVINLFEYVKYSWKESPELKHILDKDMFSDDFENILNKIWENRNKYIPEENLFYKNSSLSQNYINFKKNEIIPRNWIGSIQFKSNEIEYVVNLLPKIFYMEDHLYEEFEIKSIFAHVLWWLSASNGKFYSSHESSLGALQSDFLEIIVYIFSTITVELYSNSAYQYYHLIEEDTEAVKGQIDFTKYAGNFSEGRQHQLFCIYDSFQFDNLFNQIVKYIAFLLLGFTKNEKTRSNLEELLFILDEVENVQIIAADCDKVNLNPMHSEFRRTLDYCKLFLTSFSTYKWKNEYEVFALLIPAEKLFENLIFSTYQNNQNSLINSINKTIPNKSHLAKQLPSNNKMFKLINDIVIHLNNGEPIILDTKYKKIYNIDDRKEEQEDSDDESVLGNETRFNISQSDIFQMVSYAVGKGVSDLALLYPALPFDDKESTLPIYEIEDALAKSVKINIFTFELSITHPNALNLNTECHLRDIFKESEAVLVKELKELVNSILSHRNHH